MVRFYNGVEGEYVQKWRLEQMSWSWEVSLERVR